MDLRDWIVFMVVFALGVILIQISHGKIVNTAKLSFQFSPGFLKIIRYLGLLIVAYSCYGVIIDYAVAV